MRSGGKRLRPRLCEAVYRHFRPDGDADLKPILEAIESFHKASLIHDDIQDADRERYGRPTVWVEHGIPVAIAAGDWLLAHGLELISDCRSAAADEMHRVTIRAIRILCEGQGDELTGRGDYLSICRAKTGSLFALAAELGALAAEADPAPLHDWGVEFGVLFQLHDDREDGKHAKTGLRLEDLIADFKRSFAAYDWLSDFHLSLLQNPR